MLLEEIEYIIIIFYSLYLFNIKPHDVASGCDTAAQATWLG